MIPLSLKVLLDHIANYLLNNNDKDGHVWFANGAFLVLVLLCGHIGIPNKHGRGGGGSDGRGKAKATVWSFASMHFPEVLSSLL